MSRRIIIALFALTVSLTTTLAQADSDSSNFDATPYTSNANTDDLNPTTYNLHTGPYVSANAGAGLGATTDSDDGVSGGFLGIGGGGAVGYQFNPYVGVEAGYTGMAGIFDGSVSIFDAAVKGVLPVGNRIYLFGKAGVANTTVKVCDFLSNSGDCESTSSVGPYLGAGLGVAVSHNVDLSVEYNGSIVSNSDVYSSLVGVLGLGVTVHF